MDHSTSWLEWLVLGAGYELMLFALVGILLNGLDDLLFDALWLATPRQNSPSLVETPLVAGTFAVFVPAWKEAPVLPATLRRMLAAWEDDDVRIYVGCYPNDTATLFAVSPLIARDPRLRLVVGEQAGPTTKGDNLNRLWAALCEDERAENRHFAAVVLHDAEDHVHRDELALYRRHLVNNAMVQIPVVPLYSHKSSWISRHYGDEFAEAHGKELVVRSHLGMPIPSAGVGCALSRNALGLLAIERGGDPFRRDSLTEDYEVGMLIGAYGLGSRFVAAVGRGGDPIVSRGSFPEERRAAVKQKARWITGIALAGWDHLGWPESRRDRAGLLPSGAWVARWMLWRDRRAPLAALILLAAHIGLIILAIGWAGQGLFGWQEIMLDDGMRLLLSLDVVMLVWRLALRSYFTTRWYGWRQGLLSLPRAFGANLVAIFAARRAILLYWRMLRSGEVVWDKTEHLESDLLAEAAAVPIVLR